MPVNLCGGLNANSLIGSGSGAIIRRCDFVEVGVAVLEEVCYIGLEVSR